MKLLFDENLSPRLVLSLSDLYPDSAHVHECGLGSASDLNIWQFAKENGYTIVSKDSDFQDQSIVLGAPPKVIWLRLANCTSAEIEGLLRSASTVIHKFIAEDAESYLVLGARLK